MGAFKRSRCGLVEIVPTNDHVVLQAHPSRQAHSGNLKVQMHSSYVVTDPKGQLLSEVGTMLRRGAPKLDENGKPMRDARGKVIYEPYRIKVLNTINFKKSMKYNPFAYIRSEKDILKLVNVIIANTKGDGEKSSEDFWVSATRSLAVKSQRTNNKYRCLDNW